MASLVLFTLSALSLPANLLIVTVFYWAGTHQIEQSSPPTSWAVVAVTFILLVMGGMLWSIRQGRRRLGLALAALQLLPTLLLSANLAFVALR